MRKRILALKYRWLFKLTRALHKSFDALGYKHRDDEVWTKTTDHKDGTKTYTFHLTISTRAEDCP